MFKMSACNSASTQADRRRLHSSMAWFTTDWSSSQHTIRCAHKSGDVINFVIVAYRISSSLKWYKNYKNRFRLAKVIVKNKMSRFYGSLCIHESVWYIIWSKVTVFRIFYQSKNIIFTSLIKPYCTQNNDSPFSHHGHLTCFPTCRISSI